MLIRRDFGGEEKEKSELQEREGDFLMDHRQRTLLPGVMDVACGIGDDP